MRYRKRNHNNTHPGRYFMIFNFSAASKDEPYIYGSAAPGFPWRPGQGLPRWLEMVQRFEVRRICCLLSEDQLNTFGNLREVYPETFGPDNVCFAPMPDHEPAPLRSLRDEVLPFLFEADARGEKTIVHCLAGLGRTGQALAAWNVCGRGMTVEEAMRAVREMGREPEEAVQHGNAEPGEIARLLEACAESYGQRWESGT